MQSINTADLLAFFEVTGIEDRFSRLIFERGLDFIDGIPDNIFPKESVQRLCYFCVAFLNQLPGHKERAFVNSSVLAAIVSYLVKW